MNSPHGPASATNAALLGVQAFMTPSPVPSISTELLVSADGELNRELHRFLFDPPSNPERLRGKKIAICHGQWVMASAGILKGKKATDVWNIHPDLANAGATVLDEPVVVDGNLITARFPYDLPRMVEQLVKQLVG